MPSNNSQHNTKEIVSELCDRIKSEYANMYSHIQNLKLELDKVNNQRADYERFYTLNQDMTYLFNSEIHKMMEVIKRLITACMQQVPFLPHDLQQSCMHLIEQVKHYTTNDVTPPMFMPHGQPPPPQGHHLPPPTPGQHNMSHHMGPPPPPPHGVGPMMPAMHGGSHMPSHMMQYSSRMPPPSNGMHCSDVRDQFPPPPHHPSHHEMIRYMYNKDKDYNQNMGNADSCNGVNSKERVRHSSSGSKYGPGPPSGPVQYPYPKANVAEQQPSSNGGDESPKEEIQENESGSEKYYSEEPQVRENAEADQSPASETSTGKCNTSNTSPSQAKPRKNNDTDNTVTAQSGPISPSPKQQKLERANVSGSSSRLTNMSYPRPGQHCCTGMPRPGYNGSSMSDIVPPSNYPPMNMPPPPYIRPGHPSPSYEHMMMMRNNMPPNSYGPMPPYPMQPPGMGPMRPYSPYPGDFSDNSYANCNNNNNNNITVGLPKSFNMLTSLQHGDVVCSVTFSTPSKYAFTGSKGTVKVWDINEISTPKLLTSIDCLNENYVRACKSINDNKLLIVSGEHSSVGIWNLTQNNSTMTATIACELTNPSPVCYGMAVSKDEKNCYCCCSNGSIICWDIETQRVSRSFTGHVDGATCIDLIKEGNIIWTGGLDATARCWDIRESRQIHTHTFQTQVFALSIAPTSDYFVVGLENKSIEMVYTKGEFDKFGDRHSFRVHESCVLTVKISNSGKWLISSSKDNYTNCVRMPIGQPLFMTRESASILSTDISNDDKYVITGGGEKKASIYECIYPSN